MDSDDHYSKIIDGCDTLAPLRLEGAVLMSASIQEGEATARIADQVSNGLDFDFSNYFHR